MGRPRKPTQDKLVRGNPGKRAIDTREPDPDYLEDLTPPAWLPAAAQEIWREYAPHMRRAKLLTVVDVEPFARWCHKVAKWRAAVSDLERMGVLVQRAQRDSTAEDGGDADAASRGGAIINQLVFVESMWSKQLLALEREFGMSPASRTRVQVNPQLSLFGSHDREGEEHPYFTGPTAH